MQTVEQLREELRTRNQDAMVVVSHFFDEFSEVDVVMKLAGMDSPMLWGNPGSSLKVTPDDDERGYPGEVLLISSSENEAYSTLRRAKTAETEARVEWLLSNRPALAESTDLPLTSRRTVSRETLRNDMEDTRREAMEADRELARALGAESRV